MLVEYTFNISTWEAEADGSPWVRGHPGLQSEFQGSQDYTEKPCLEKPKPPKQQQQKIKPLFWNLIQPEQMKRRPEHRLEEGQARDTAAAFLGSLHWGEKEGWTVHLNLPLETKPQSGTAGGQAIDSYRMHGWEWK